MPGAGSASLPSMAGTLCLLSRLELTFSTDQTPCSVILGIATLVLVVLAGGMVKGRATAHTQIVENALEGTTIGIQLAESDECEPAAVAAKLSKTLKVEVTL